MVRATALLNVLVTQAHNGDAHICTYSWAYRHIFDTTYLKWSQAYASQVVAMAQDTAAADLIGLGTVRLDAFVVNRRTGLPSDGHWDAVNYERGDWERVLGTATLLE